MNEKMSCQEGFGKVGKRKSKIQDSELISGELTYSHVKKKVVKGLKVQEKKGCQSQGGRGYREVGGYQARERSPTSRNRREKDPVTNLQKGKGNGVLTYLVEGAGRGKGTRVSKGKC